MKVVNVNVRFDRQRQLWFVGHCDIPGVTAEAASLDEICTMLPHLIQGLIEANGEKVTEEFQVKITARTPNRVQKTIVQTSVH